VTVLTGWGWFSRQWGGERKKSRKGIKLNEKKTMAKNANEKKVESNGKTTKRRRKALSRGKGAQ